MSAPAPRLRIVTAPRHPEGIVLLLHGGRERGFGRVRANQLAVIRMMPIAWQVARAGDRRLAVVRLQNRVRGWNRPELPPVEDARWALARVRERFGPDLPICLIGHSMGGRSAMRVAGEKGVHSVVGLAPWLPDGEPITQLAGRQVLLVHGSKDRTTSPVESQRFADALRAVAASISLVVVPGERHGLLRRRGIVEELTAGFARATLLGTDPAQATQTESAPVANLLQRVLAGEARLVV